MDYAKESLRLHTQWKGKIEIQARVPVETKDDLSLAYTPGVAQPCLEIQKDVEKSYELTRRGNLCAVITDGSAVQGAVRVADGGWAPDLAVSAVRRTVRSDAEADRDGFPVRFQRRYCRQGYGRSA